MYNEQGLCDGGFYTQRFFKTAIAKPVLYDSLSQRMPNMPKGEHSRTSEKDVRQ